MVGLGWFGWFGFVLVWFGLVWFVFGWVGLGWVGWFVGWLVGWLANFIEGIALFVYTTNILIIGWVCPITRHIQ